MNQALEFFQRVPRTHNCSQSVAAGCGHPELVAELGACGGGHAPGGRCGALHAAMLIVPEIRRETVRQAFIEANGSEFCRELKTVYHTPCSQCVETAASLTEQEG